MPLREYKFWRGNHINQLNFYLFNRVSNKNKKEYGLNTNFVNSIMSYDFNLNMRYMFTLNNISCLLLICMFAIYLMNIIL